MTEYTSGEFYLLSARGVSYFCVLLRKQGTARLPLRKILCITIDVRHNPEVLHENYTFM